MDSQRPSALFHPDGSSKYNMITPETSAAAAGVLMLALHARAVPFMPAVPRIGGADVAGPESFAAGLSDILPPNNFDL